MAGRGSAASTSPTVYASFTTPTKALPIRASTEALSPAEPIAAPCHGGGGLSAE
jgi:hypothetical protein